MLSHFRFISGGLSHRTVESIKAPSRRGPQRSSTSSSIQNIFSGVEGSRKPARQMQPPDFSIPTSQRIGGDGAFSIYRGDTQRRSLRMTSRTPMDFGPPVDHSSPDM